MPCVELMVAIDVGQSIVIQIKYKRLRFEIMNPMVQGPNNSIELLIIGGIVES